MCNSAGAGQLYQPRGSMFPGRNKGSGLSLKRERERESEEEGGAANKQVCRRRGKRGSSGRKRETARRRDTCKRGRNKGKLFTLAGQIIGGEREQGLGQAAIILRGNFNSRILASGRIHIAAIYIYICISFSRLCVDHASLARRSTGKRKIISSGAATTAPGRMVH